MTGNGLAIRSRTLRLPKRGHTAEEYEDASAGDPERGRFAVADGAAESSFAALWAGLLVEDYVRAPDGGRWEQGLPDLRRRWAAEAGGSANGRPTPWYFEHKLQQGAFATFLGVSVRGTASCGRRHRRLLAVAVGDSCLFQVRKDALFKAFPLTASAEFGNAPRLVESRQTPPRRKARLKGHWRVGDRLWLMTDALAQRFLQEAETGGRPWQRLEEMLAAADSAFAAWVENLRDAGRLRNDDVTVVGVCL